MRFFSSHPNRRLHASLSLNYPPLTFCPLSEIFSGHRRFLASNGCRLIRMRKLTSLGFGSLQHLPELGVYLARVCLTLSVALSGFGYPLSDFLLPEPLSRFFRPKRSWDFPLQSFSHFEERQPLSRLFALLPLALLAPAGYTRQRSDFRALLPPKSRVLRPGIAQKAEPLLSWGFASLGPFPLRPCQPLQADSSFALWAHYPEDDDNEPGALEFFCRRTAWLHKEAFLPL